MYCIVLYRIVLYCIVLYRIVSYCIVCIVLYCIVLYCIVNVGGSRMEIVVTCQLEHSLRGHCFEMGLVRPQYIRLVASPLLIFDNVEKFSQDAVYCDHWLGP